MLPLFMLIFMQTLVDLHKYRLTKTKVVRCLSLHLHCSQPTKMQQIMARTSNYAILGIVLKIIKM